MHRRLEWQRLAGVEFGHGWRGGRPTTYGEEVAAGGFFTAAGGVSASSIAFWDGVAWRAPGSGVDGGVRALSAFSGELIAGGEFTLAGQQPAAYLARWACDRPGDLNCDGLVNTFDIDPFVQALTSPEMYAATFVDCNYMLADVNGDGAVNAFDIDPFAVLLTGGER